MKILYFDCFAGVSGDMTLGALVSAGADRRELLAQLALLDVTGYEVSFAEVDRAGIGAVRALVTTPGAQHHHRHLGDIHKIIFASRLSEGVKKRAAGIFERLAGAEARVHNVAIERIHFHEVGALDAIVDVVGACIGVELLGVERCVCSALHVGSGMVEMAHGRFPIPPPAVAELLRDAPLYATEITGELVTPTGAAIISTLCESYGPLPQMRVKAIGYGAGNREYARFPNVLRVIVGETEGARMGTAAGEAEKLLVIETNIDDISPQIVGHVMDEALARGALDCFLTPVQMKKNRPGVQITLLCAPDQREEMLELLFAETTTLGIRYHEIERQTLKREFVRVETEFGPIEIKVGRRRGGVGDQIQTATPEYEQCREAARRAQVPLRVVEATARAAYVRLVAGEK